MSANKRVAVVVLALAMVGCESEPLEVGESDSALTWGTYTPTLSPRYVILGRIAAHRQAASDLRALAATPMPTGASWTDVNRYWEITAFSTQQAKELNTVASYLEASLAVCTTTSQLDQLSEMSEMESLKMQMVMDRMVKADTAISNAMKKFSEIMSGIIANMK